MLESLKNYISEVNSQYASAAVDIDEILRMMAAENLTVNIQPRNLGCSLKGRVTPKVGMLDIVSQKVLGSHSYSYTLFTLSYLKTGIIIISHNCWSGY